MTLTFHGAAQEVTGSAHLLTLDDGCKILMDCVLYQGRNQEMEHFNQTFAFDPAEIDVLLLSHAHIDHSGRVPKLVKEGLSGQDLRHPRHAEPVRDPATGLGLHSGKGR